MDSQQCQVCGEVFINIDVVRSHIGSHSRKEIYECLLSFKSSLEIFMKQYFGLKEYVQRNSNQRNDEYDKNGNSDHDPDGSWNCSLSQSHNNQMSHAPESDNNYLDSNSQFQEETAQLRQPFQDKESKDNVDCCIDLTNIEIKQEVDDSSEIYVTSMSENVSCNGFNSKVIGDNSFSETVTEDNSFSETNNFGYSRQNDSNEETVTLQRKAPVSIIDLSQNEQGIMKCSKRDENGRQHNKVTNGSCIRNDGVDNHDSPALYITPNNAIEKNKPKTKPVPNLTGKTIQLLARELTMKAEYMKQSHSGTTCLDCGRTFSTKFVLRRHMMSHTGERTHTCPICGKGFIGKQNMMVHLRVHTGEKPYKCSHCGQQFTQYGTLYRHKKRHMVSGDVKTINVLGTEYT